MTSKYEGFPNALIEAMSVGLPAVVFDCPSGPREISLNGKVAILVKLNSEDELRTQLKYLMMNKRLRKELGKAGKHSVIKRFSIDSILKQWEDLFQDLLITN